MDVIRIKKQKQTNSNVKLKSKFYKSIRSILLVAPLAGSTALSLCTLLSALPSRQFSVSPFFFSWWFHGNWWVSRNFEVLPQILIWTKVLILTWQQQDIYVVILKPLHTFGFVCFRKINPLPNQSSLSGCRIWQHLAAFILLSTLTQLTGPAVKKHPSSMSLITPGFESMMVRFCWCMLFG